MKHLIVNLLICVGINTVVAQEGPPTSNRKNIIKLDLTTKLWYSNAYGISYERITKPNQSFAITLGYQEFPITSRLGQNIAVKEDRNKDGYKFGGEYRFYLKKENKYNAPRGIYIGPYFTRHSFTNERVLEIDNDGTPEEAILNSKLTIFNLGFQLGYQFVLNNRWTIDVVFIGPSFSNYRYKLTLGGNYTFDPEDIQNEIILDLLDRFPLLDEVISEKEATSSGRLDSWAYGYRYQLQVGYHFGRKK
jgi:hypothetical protein